MTVLRYLPKLPNITNLLPLQGAEISRDTAVLQIHHSSERLIEEGANGSDGEAAGFGCEGVDHGFEAHVDFAGADDLGDI